MLNTEGRKMNKLHKVLILVIILGILVRVIGLGTESIWLDEGYSVHCATKGITGLLGCVQTYQSVPFLYYTFLHYWTSFFGISEFSIRFLSVIFGAVSIFLVFLLGKKLFNKQTGLIASLMFSISMLQVQYAQDARSYTMFLFLTLLSVIFFIDLVRKKDLKSYIFYTIFTTLLIYTHYLGFVVLFVQNLIMVIHNRKARNWFVSQSAIFILYLPWLLVFLRLVYKIWFLSSFMLINKLNFPVFIAKISPFLFGIFLIFICVFAVLFFKSFFRIIKEGSGLMIFILYIMISLLVLPFAYSSIFFIRYSLFLLPFVYLIVGFGIAKRKPKMRQLMVLSIILLNVAALSIYYAKTTNEEWEAAVGYIETNENPGDIILINNADLKFSFDYYYKGTSDIIGLGTSLQSLEDPLSIGSDELSGLIGDKGVWLILSHDYRTKGYYKDVLDKAYTPVLTETFKGINILYYK